MKKIISLILILMMMGTSSVFADNGDITVLVNNRELVSDVAAQIVNDRTMLPMRAIFEALKAKVTWADEDKMIFAAKDDCLITMKIDCYQMSVQKIGSNENKAIELDTAPFIYEDRTLVPVRAIAEALNAKVDWIDETKTVVIVTE